MAWDSARAAGIDEAAFNDGPVERDDEDNDCWINSLIYRSSPDNPLQPAYGPSQRRLTRIGTKHPVRNILVTVTN